MLIAVFEVTRPNAFWVTDRAYVVTWRGADRHSVLRPALAVRGVSYDNPLAETINGLYKTQVIRHHGPWIGMEAVEVATLEWAD